MGSDLSGVLVSLPKGDFLICTLSSLKSCSLCTLTFDELYDVFI